MNLATWLKRRLRILFRRDEVESDLSDEIQLHLDMESEELARQGRSTEEARREARLSLGGVEQTKESVRAARPLHWIEGLGLDFRLGLRMLRKSWGLTLVGGLAMVVVIAACATAFVILDTVRGGAPLPLPEGDRVVSLTAFDRAKSDSFTSVRHFERWRAAMRSVQDLAAFRTIERDLITPDGDATRVSIARMTAGGFRVARVQPLLGRFLVEQDDRPGADRVVVIGYELWHSRFAGDPAVLGRTVQIGGSEHTIVGIMPGDFAFPINHRAWTALGVTSPDERVRIFGRLAPGVTIERARAELASIGADLLDVTEQKAPLQVTSLNRYAASFGLIVGNNSPWVFRIIPLLLALLLIPPCANIAILIYARNVTRTEEFGARYVLGAGRGRIVGQLLVETLVLTMLAGGAALLMTHRLLEWARGYANQDPELRTAVPYWMKPNLSFESILYVAGLVLFAAVIAGGVPALRATGRIAQSGFKGLGIRTGGPRLSRTWTALVALQVALAMAVLPFATDQVMAALRPAIFGPGFAAEEYVTAQLEMDRQAATPGEDALQRGARFRDLRTQLARRLGVESGVLGATVSSAIPEVEPISAAESDVPGQERFLATSNAVDPAFFKVFAAPLLTGRWFEPADFNPGRPVVIVTRAFTQTLAAGVNPLGVRVRELAGPTAEPGPWLEVVGVVDDLSTRDRIPTIYRTMQPGEDRNAVSLALRVGPVIPAGLAERIGKIATGLDPGLRVDRLRRLDAVYQEAQQDERIVSFTLAVMVVIVFLFSAAGIHTLAAFAVAQRRREIAIRSAMGASPRRLVADIFGRTLSPVIAGVVLGALLAVYLDNKVENDFSSIGLPVCAAFMIAIGLSAVAGPARRALRVDAADALRES